MEIMFSGNDVHPEIVLINSTLLSSIGQVVVGFLNYNLDGEIGNPFMNGGSLVDQLDAGNVFDDPGTPFGFLPDILVRPTPM